MRSVLVITHRRDVTADFVVAELDRRGAAVMRFDLAEYPEHMTCTSLLGAGQAGWAGLLRTEHRSVDLADVGSVYYRRPQPFGVAEELNPTERQWATAEARSGLGGLLAALPNVLWVNHPHRNVMAADRPRQLAVAAECGLAIPDSLLTNEPEQARDFCRQHRAAGVIYKPLTVAPRGENGKPVALLASTVTAEQIPDTVARTSHLFQVRVPCASWVRLVTVGEEMFAARIDAPPGSTALDLREIQDELSYSRIEVPNDVAAGMRRLMRRFELTFSSSDWGITPEGTWTFLGDLNANGQWAFLPPIHDDIVDALATTLTKGAP